MNMALMVDKLHANGCKFLLTYGNRSLPETQKAVLEGRRLGPILMAIQHDVLPEYAILVLAEYVEEGSVERFGFHPVKKDKANWIPIQYKNRKGKEHLNSRDGDWLHTSNHNYLPVEEVHEYIKLVEKQEQINLIYK